MGRVGWEEASRSSAKAKCPTVQGNLCPPGPPHVQGSPPHVPWSPRDGVPVLWGQAMPTSREPWAHDVEKEQVGSAPCLHNRPIWEFRKVAGT